MPAVVIQRACQARKYLYAPSFIYLHTLPLNEYSPRKTPRGIKNTIATDLQTQAGREVAAEIAWVEGWLEKRAEEAESKRRKEQEEADAETARQLNFKEHEEAGGLLEWYIYI